MQQGGGVNELNRRRQTDLEVALIAEHLRRRHGEDGTQALAASLNQVGAKLGDARGVL